MIVDVTINGVDTGHYDATESAMYHHDVLAGSYFWLITEQSERFSAKAIKEGQDDWPSRDVFQEAAKELDQLPDNAIDELLAAAKEAKFINSYTIEPVKLAYVEMWPAYRNAFMTTFYRLAEDIKEEYGLTDSDFKLVEGVPWQEDMDDYMIRVEPIVDSFEALSEKLSQGASRVDVIVQAKTDAQQTFEDYDDDRDWDDMVEEVRAHSAQYSENNLFTAFEDSFGRYLDDPSVSGVEDEEVLSRAWDRFFFGGGVANITAVAYEAIKADLFDNGVDSRFENDANADAAKWIDDHWDNVMAKWQEAVEEVQ